MCKAITYSARSETFVRFLEVAKSLAVLLVLAGTFQTSREGQVQNSCASTHPPQHTSHSSSLRVLWCCGDLVFFKLLPICVFSYAPDNTQLFLKASHCSSFPVPTWPRPLWIPDQSQSSSQILTEEKSCLDEPSRTKGTNIDEMSRPRPSQNGKQEVATFTSTFFFYALRSGSAAGFGALLSLLSAFKLKSECIGGLLFFPGQSRTHCFTCGWSRFIRAS